MKIDSVFELDSGPPHARRGLDRFALLSNVLAGMFGLLIYLYLFLVIVLPSGSIFGINFKFVLYGLLLPSALCTLNRLRPVRLSEIAFLLMAPAAFLLWVVEAQVYGFEIAGSMRQYTDVLLTLFTCWLAALFCRRNKIANIQFIRAVIASETVASSLKCGLLLYALLRGVRVTVLVESIDRIFGVDLMTMDLGVLFGRIQFVSDGLIPLCIFAILRYRQRLKIGAFVSLIAIALLSFSVILSFSRYFWAYTLLALTMGLILGKKDRVYAIILVSLVAATLSSIPLLSNLYRARFSQEVAGESDSARVEQIEALKSFFMDAPLLGHGLGSYTSQVIRSDTDAKYSYEVQLLALLGQMGFFGMVLLSAMCVFYFRCLWPKNRSEVINKATLFLLLMAWLASGLFNPLLINPVGAFSYALIMCMGSLVPSQEGSVRRSFVLHSFKLPRTSRAGEVSG